ncbi:hypothetical protein ZWY2020_048977 [Hordeum vulgare]|nr:hypothetical protein ZWY2020_048977 [Hordeum vulgare]
MRGVCRRAEGRRGWVDRDRRTVTAEGLQLLISWDHLTFGSIHHRTEAQEQDSALFSPFTCPSFARMLLI